MQVRYQFDADVSPADQARIRAAVDKAIASGEILSCACPHVEAWVYETRPPEFQASLNCACGINRPLYSSTPDSGDE